MKIPSLLIASLLSLTTTHVFAQVNQEAPFEQTTQQASTTAQASEEIQQVSIRASSSVNAMRLKTVMSFPDRIKNVKETTEYLLEPIAYKLVLSPSAENDTKRILSRPLLRTNADGSLKSIEDALLQVSGDDTVLVVDHEHQLVTLEFVSPPQK